MTPLLCWIRSLAPCSARAKNPTAPIQPCGQRPLSSPSAWPRPLSPAVISYGIPGILQPLMRLHKGCPAWLLQPRVNPSVAVRGEGWGSLNIGCSPPWGRATEEQGGDGGGLGRSCWFWASFRVVLPHCIGFPIPVPMLSASPWGCIPPWGEGTEGWGWGWSRGGPTTFGVMLPCSVSWHIFGYWILRSKAEIRGGPRRAVQAAGGDLVPSRGKEAWEK